MNLQYGIFLFDQNPLSIGEEQFLKDFDLNISVYNDTLSTYDL